MPEPTKTAEKSSRGKTTQIIILIAAMVIVAGLSAYFYLNFGSYLNHGPRLAVQPENNAPAEDSARPRASAVLRLIQGQVMANAGNNDWASADADMAVANDSRLKTQTGRAIIYFPDNTILRLDNDTEIHVQNFTDQTFELNLITGRIYLRVSPASAINWQINAAGIQTQTNRAVFAQQYNSPSQISTIDVISNQVQVHYEKDNEKILREINKNTSVSFDLGQTKDEIAKETKLTASAIDRDDFLNWNQDQDEKIITENPLLNSDAAEQLPEYVIVTDQLQLTAERSGGINLTWSPSTAAGFKGCKIVRSATDSNPFYPKSPSITYLPDQTSTEFTDTTATAGGTYYYRVCALLANGPTECGNILEVGE